MKLPRNKYKYYVGDNKQKKSDAGNGNLISYFDF